MKRPCYTMKLLVKPVLYHFTEQFHKNISHNQHHYSSRIIVYTVLYICHFKLQSRQSCKATETHNNDYIILKRPQHHLSHTCMYQQHQQHTSDGFATVSSSTNLLQGPQRRENLYEILFTITLYNHIVLSQAQPKARPPVIWCGVFESGQANICRQNSELDDSNTELRSS